MRRVKSRLKTVVVIALMCAILTGCVKTPIAHKDCQGMDYNELQAKMTDAGFKNITTEDEETSDPEEVDKVAGMTIAGDFSFYEKDSFKEDDQVVIRKYVLKAKEVTISIDTTGDQGRPEFTVFTNLPKKTIITMTLENGSGYSQTEEIELDKEGKGKSHYFSQGSADLPLAGEYTLTVTMSPQKQPSKVQDEIGTKGETLTGTYVKSDETTGENIVSYEMEYKSPYSQGEIDDATKQKSFEDVVEMVQEHMENSSEDPNTHYTVVPDSGGINVTIWSDGVSKLAMAAMMGDKSSKKTWKRLTKNARRASITLQNYLDDNGYADKFVVFNIANENDLDKVLYQASRGTTLYDVMD